MKVLTPSLIFFLFLQAPAQSYKDKIDKASALLNSQDYRASMAAFRDAFTDTAQAGPLDLYLGATAAVKCQRESLAFEWLYKALNKGLGLREGEYLLIVADNNLEPLHASTRWAAFLKDIQRAIVEKQTLTAKRSQQWLAKL